MPLPSVGVPIWSRTMFWIALSLKPSSWGAGTRDRGSAPLPLLPPRPSWCGTARTCPRSGRACPGKRRRSSRSPARCRSRPPRRTSPASKAPDRARRTCPLRRVARSAGLGERLSRVGQIVKTRSSPVISKIFVIFRSLHTSESRPSWARSCHFTRTPSVVESMNVVSEKSTTTSRRSPPITSSSCCLNRARCKGRLAGQRDDVRAVDLVDHVEVHSPPSPGSLTSRNTSGLGLEPEHLHLLACLLGLGTVRG